MKIPAALIAGLLAALPCAALAQARAEGDALLAQAKASDLFDNVSEPAGGAIRLKHKASGLVCVFNPGDAANRLIVFDAPVLGDEVACSTGGEAGGAPSTCPTRPAAASTRPSPTMWPR